MWLREAIPLTACLALASPAQHAMADQQSSREQVSTLGVALQPEALARHRGGQEVTNAMEVNAKLYDNRAVDTVTGSNVISEGAFSHASGVPIAIQNSGNNVVIQNSLILNLQLK